MVLSTCFICNYRRKRQSRYFATGKTLTSRLREILALNVKTNHLFGEIHSVHALNAHTEGS